ncbi:MAG: hypothetical protein J6589_07515 [Snodgrassella sp.]|uniref:hypothetical protein n=1 Tax=Snodgrassella sp. TaxID=2815304 RepID=UPI00258D4CB7|nr:hypothetical protein [Snodgrassella sp.]MCO6514298.1 hypothetical protein [Snodgrassella sp.]MCO6520551.1 hypothetical protein [Snodgrassella sp.]
MATNVVEQMLIELGFDASKFATEAEKAVKKNKELEKSLTDTEKASKKSEKANDELAKKQHNAIEQTAKFGEAIAKVTKELTGFFAIIIGSTGLFKLANDAARANMEVSKLSGQLGMNTRSITDWRNAAGAFGGSAEGMTASLTGIKQAMNGLVMFGDASMLPYFNALGVNVVDNAGKVRQLDDVMLDLADAFQKMPRDQAYTIGKKMGFDDGTINALVSGRKELQEILDIQKQMYHSDAKAIARSKELTKQQAILNAHWQSMKQMIGDALTPILISLIKVVNGFFEFLQKHEKVVTAVFKVAAVVIGMLLIPTLLSAGRALLGFIAPFTPLIRVFGLLGAAISPVTLAITALGAAFVLLYDDYKTWSEGGKSLFDWSSFVAGIKDSKMSVDTLRTAFSNLCSAISNNFMPTLKGYAEIIGKLVRGDYDGAAKQAKEMIGTYSDIATGIIADATGEKKEDIADFIGESAYRLMHGGKDYYEQNGIEKPVDANLPVRTGGKVAQQNFRNKNFTKEKAESIARVAKNIGVDPNDLAAVISFETGGTFNPNIRNPKSSATGLIQFMAGSGGKKGLYYGMTRDQFGGLSFDEQMKYVERYFKERGFDGKRKRDIADTYTAVTGYGYKRGSKAYELNKVWDSNNDGYIDKGEMVKNASFRAHQHQYYANIANNAQKALDMVSQNQQMQTSSSSIKNDNSKQVNVNIQKFEVKTSSSTVSGNAVAAMKELNNYTFNQLGTSMT